MSWFTKTPTAGETLLANENAWLRDRLRERDAVIWRLINKLTGTRIETGSTPEPERAAETSNILDGFSDALSVAEDEAFAEALKRSQGAGGIVHGNAAAK